jgi:hypothetical protein
LKYLGEAGLGEIGLDRTEDPEKWADQILTVYRILNDLLPDYALVLHFRSVSKLANEASLSLLHLLTAHPSVNRERSSFALLFGVTGDPAEVERYFS